MTFEVDGVWDMNRDLSTEEVAGTNFDVDGAEPVVVNFELYGVEAVVTNFEDSGIWVGFAAFLADGTGAMPRYIGYVEI